MQSEHTQGAPVSCVIKSHQIQLSGRSQQRAPAGSGAQRAQAQAAQPPHTTPFSSSHCGEVRAQTAMPPLRPRAAMKSSLIQKKEKKGSPFSRFQLQAWASLYKAGSFQHGRPVQVARWVMHRRVAAGREAQATAHTRSCQTCKQSAA